MPEIKIQSSQFIHFWRADNQVSTNRNKVPDVVCMLEIKKKKYIRESWKLQIK